MNDTTYTASVLDAHRAEDLRREAELRVQHAEHDADAGPRAAATTGGAMVTPAASVARGHRFTWPHRAHRTTSVATR